MSQDTSEFEWLAFQYLAGELEPAALEAFELRLATDQVAREALAAATQISQSAAIVFATTTMCSTGEHRLGSLPFRRFANLERWARPLGWMAVGAAACVAALFVASLPMFSGAGTETAQNPPGASSGRVSVAEGRQLAMLWAESELDVPQNERWQLEWIQPATQIITLRPEFETFDLVDGESDLVATVDPELADATDEIDDSDELADQALAIPGWLLAAVSVEQGMPEQVPVEEN